VACVALRRAVPRVAYPAGVGSDGGLGVVALQLRTELGLDGLASRDAEADENEGEEGGTGEQHS
jgi:hypothetical protein